MTTRPLKAWALRFAPARWLRRAVRGAFEGEDVTQVVDLMVAAGVEPIVSGGWAVDALAGTHTRKHLDLDLVVDEADLPRAVLALEQAGFEVRFRQRLADITLPVSVVLVDPRRRHVDLHPVDLSAFPPASIALGDAEALEQGSICGRPIRCLSAALQLAIHREYVGGETQRHDHGVLTRSVPPAR